MPGYITGSSTTTALLSIDASNYIDKVHILYRAAKSGAAMKRDITDLFMSSKIDLGMANIVHERSDSMDRLTAPTSTPALTRSIVDSTFSRVYNTDTGDKGKFSFYPILNADAPMPDSTPDPVELELLSTESSGILLDLSSAGSANVIDRVDKTFEFADDANRLLYTDTGTSEDPITVPVITCNVQDKAFAELTLKQYLVGMPGSLIGLATTGNGTEHQIDVSPLNIMTQLTLDLSLDIVLKDNFLELLEADGYLVAASPLDPIAYPVTGDLIQEGVNITSSQTPSGGWFSHIEQPTAEIPLAVNIGYLPIFEHVFDAPLKTVSDISGCVTSSVNTETGANDLIGVSLSENAAFNGAVLNGDFKHDLTVIRPGKVTLKQTLRNVKIYSKSGFDGSANDV